MSYIPPLPVQQAARLGLELRRKYRRGGTAVGVARARDLSNGRAVSETTLKRMRSYFARHEVDKNSPHWNDPSAGKVAWLLWGGDTGRTWAERMLGQIVHSNPETYLQCAWCNRLMRKSGKPFGKPVSMPPGTSHGICNECLAKMLKEIKDQRVKESNPKLAAMKLDCPICRNPINVSTRDNYVECPHCRAALGVKQDNPWYGETERHRQAALLGWEVRRGLREKTPRSAYYKPKKVKVTETAKAITPENIIAISPNDVSYQFAERAYSGISWEPDKRAAMVQREYVQHMEQVRDSLLPLADTPEKREKLQEGLRRYKEGYLRHLNAYLAAKSRVVSSFIAGPSKFPARQMEKRNQTEEKRLNELIEWDKQAQKKLKAEIAPETSRVISSDDPNATSLLGQKIAKAQEFQQVMVAANKVVRQKISDQEKVDRLVSLGLKETTAWKLLQPDFAGRIGFPDYALKNNSAEIRRLQARVSEVEQNKATPSGEIRFSGGKIIDNADENRIQIIFDSKPDESIRSKLKSYGFKWAPSQGAWQRQRTENARYAISQLFPDAK